MKKILSILLALSVACGSIMLTACGDDEKEDDDDKSVSDKDRDEDEEEDDKDKSDKDEDEDEESSEDEEESSEDEEEESSEDEEEESSEDEEEESSEDEEEESSEDEEESSENEPDASGRIEFGEISFILPEDMDCDISDDYISYEDDTVTFSVEPTGAGETLDELSEEAFEEAFGMLGELTDTVYEVREIDGCDAVYYSGTIVYSDEDLGFSIDMDLVVFAILTENDSYGFTAMTYSDGETVTDISFIDEVIDSIEVL